MVRMQQTPHFPMGTRISKRFKGYPNAFSGTVDDYAPKSGFYHIRYDDGDSEEMIEDDVEHYLKMLPGAAGKKRARPSTTSSEAQSASSETSTATSRVKNRSKSKASPSFSSRRKEQSVGKTSVQSTRSEVPDATTQTKQTNGTYGVSIHVPDANADASKTLVGQRICRTQIDSDGNLKNMQGSVTAYFSANKKYRVIYQDGSCEDLTQEEVEDSIPLSSPRPKKRKSTNGDANGTSSPSKKQKTAKSNDKENSNGTPTESTTAKRVSDHDEENNSIGDNSPVASLDSQDPVSPVASDEMTKPRALKIVRQILFVLVSTKGITCDLKSEQLRILSKKNLKNKAALTQFVLNDGLKSLHDLLCLWSEDKAGEQGILLLIKALSLLPGVSIDAISNSKIGKKLRKICKGREMNYKPDETTVDMAMWLIKRWKSEFSIPEKDSPKPNPATKVVESPKAASSFRPKPTPSSTGFNPFANKSIKRRPIKSKSAGHLQALMSSRSGGLGARRSSGNTVLMEQIRQRALMNSEAREKEAIEDEQQNLKPRTPSRIKWGENNRTVVFDNDLEVTKLFESSSKSNLGRKSSVTPLKPILKVRFDTMAQDGSAAAAGLAVSVPVLVDEENNADDVETKSDLVVMPPSPPRRRTASDQSDENDVNQNDNYLHYTSMLEESGGKSIAGDETRDNLLPFDAKNEMVMENTTSDPTSSPTATAIGESSHDKAGMKEDGEMDKKRITEDDGNSNKFSATDVAAETQDAKAVDETASQVPPAMPTTNAISESSHDDVDMIDDGEIDDT